MKTQISRRSFKQKKRYSGVYQQMGRMVTDADWNEFSDIVKQQLYDALTDVIGSGVPRKRGLVSQITPDNYELRWGHVYVDGIHALVVPDNNDLDTDFSFQRQADFPGLTELEEGEHRLYLDVWERTVTQLEDSDLLDQGLKGADTCTRTQVMAQVKACSLDYDREDIEENSLINPCIGDIQVDLSIREGQTLADPCDPCAEELALPEDVGNFLFRLEVHEVIWSDETSPRVIGLTLKWSSENAAEAYQVLHNPPGFQSGDWAYEFFSGPSETAAINMTTEKHLGHHLMAGFMPARGVLTDGFQPELAPAMTLVRRWDGFAVFAFDGAEWELNDGYDRGHELSTAYSDIAHGYVDIDSRTQINLNQLLLRFTLQDAIALAGDFWQTEVRQSIHSAGSELLNNELPNGIKHHYWLLGRARVEHVADENEVTEFIPEGEACHAFEFPAITDLSSGDVCYSMPECGNADQQSIRSLLEKTLGHAFPDAGENTQVKTILDALLCQHAATTLPIIKNDQLCPTLQADTVVSVQDALNALCQREIDGCATYTVFPRPGWESVFDLIPNGGDAHICFREGSYPLDRVVNVQNKGHLSISGAGQGTHLFSRTEAVLQFENCLSVSMTAMYLEGRSANTASQHIQHLNGALTCIDCAQVDVSHTTLRCAAGIRLAATCLTISHTGTRSGSASVRENKLEVGHRQIGMQLNSLVRNSVESNHIVTRPKPRTFTLERQLSDRRVALKARKYLINDSLVRGFDRRVAAGKKNIQLSDNRQRRIMIDSPIAANVWKENIERSLGQRALRSNQELLNVTKAFAYRVVTDERIRTANLAFANWFELLRQQNPAVAFKGIVCGGRIATDLRILNNTIEGVQEGIHVGLSDRKERVRRRYIAGRVIIENNSINVRIPPLLLQRRGGIFLGNCNHATISKNQISVQRYLWTRATDVEAIRVYGELGRMMIIEQNYATHCSTGIRFVPLDPDLKARYQWIVADNLTADVGLILSTPYPHLVTARNNIK